MATMFDFCADPAQPKAVLYDDLLSAAGALVDGESDAVANMANVAALMWQFVPDLNWAGFYRMIDSQLVLGPFVGKPACLRIELGQGVCGTAAKSGETQRVDDVQAFLGHIACDGETKSELVVPVVAEGRVIAVIDLDSPLAARFDAEDASGIEALSARIAAAIAG